MPKLTVAGGVQTFTPTLSDFNETGVRIPTKANAYSGGKPNSIPGEGEHHRSVATLAF